MTDLLNKYRELVANPPEPGTILRTMSGVRAELEIKVEAGKPPFISGRAFVSEVLDTNLGWYLREPDDPNPGGWRCILMTKARREAVSRSEDDAVYVAALRVVRVSESGKALLCEVADYGSD